MVPMLADCATNAVPQISEASSISALARVERGFMQCGMEGRRSGRGWHARLQAALAETQAAPASGGALSLTFEVIYGHAVRAPPRHAVSSQTAIQLGDMRAALRRRGQNPHGV